MSFVESYAKIKQGVVAITRAFYKEDELGREFPEILGTGFLCSESGLVCTCRHVVELLEKLPRAPGYKGYPAHALLFVDVEHQGRKAVGFLNLDIEDVGHAEMIGPQEGYLGPNPPDVSFLLLSVRETPAVKFAGSTLREGEEIAFTGFPMGTNTLTAPGCLQQFSPTLHSGIVSAILPHDSSPLPHGFLVHAHTQGGASGSPVFTKSGEVVGMVYSVYNEFRQMTHKNASLTYSVPTSFTACVPAHVITAVLELAEGDPSVKRSCPTLEEHLDSRPLQEWRPGTGFFSPWRETDND